MAEKITPTYDFEQFFGKNPEEHFSAARVASAERVLARAVEEAETDALKNMHEMIETMIGQVAKITVGTIESDVIDNIYAQAFTIKCNAGMYGFPLATAFANQLFYYCKNISGKPMANSAQASISAHLSALRLIFKNNIRSISDPIAQELLKELERIGEIR
jgi:chemotaxis protein histidine kinase CheA